MPRFRLMLVLTCLTAAGQVARASSADAQVPPRVEATLLLRVLGMDTALPRRSSVPLVIAVVHPQDSQSSGGHFGEMLDALREIAQAVTVHGANPSVVPVAWSADLGDDLRAIRAGAVYVTAGLAAELEDIAGVCAELQLATLAGMESYVSDGGLAVAVIERDNHPQILINLSVARAGGMELDPRVLGLAEIVR